MEENNEKQVKGSMTVVTRYARMKGECGVVSVEKSFGNKKKKTIQTEGDETKYC